ncbi:MAG: hypothetical protein ACRC57_01745 [Sarcina sp.]
MVNLKDSDYAELFKYNLNTTLVMVNLQASVAFKSDTLNLNTTLVMVNQRELFY